MSEIKLLGIRRRKKNLVDFRCFNVRVPMERDAELLAAAKSIGVDPTSWIRMQAIKELDRLREEKASEAAA